MTAMLEVTGADGQNSPHPLAALGPRIGIRENTTISVNERQGGLDAVWLSILAKFGMACASAGKDFDASAGPGQETEEGSPGGADLPDKKLPALEMHEESPSGVVQERTIRSFAATPACATLPAKSQLSSEILPFPNPSFTAVIPKKSPMGPGLDTRTESKTESAKLAPLDEEKEMQLQASLVGRMIPAVPQPQQICAPLEQRSNTSCEPKKTDLPSSFFPSEPTKERTHPITMLPEVRGAERVQPAPHNEEASWRRSMTQAASAVPDASELKSLRPGGNPIAKEQKAWTVGPPTNLPQNAAEDDRGTARAEELIEVAQLRSTRSGMSRSAHTSGRPFASIEPSDGRGMKIDRQISGEGAINLPSPRHPLASVAQGCFMAAAGNESTVIQAARHQRVVEGILDHPFQALDRPAAHLEQQWVHAGAHFAEAGFQDSALGWVSVRAARDSTGVHAVVVPASSDAGTMLSSHLLGLNAHLAENHLEVSPVTISAVHDQSLHSGIGGESQGDARSQHHGSGEPQDSREIRRVGKATFFGEMVRRREFNRFESASTNFITNGRDGVHISLVA